MTGLSKIIDRISQDSAAKCDTIIFNARNEANKIRETAVLKGEALKKEAVYEAKAQAGAIIETAVSDALLNTNKIVTDTENELINETINIAIDRLKALPDEDYFSAVYALVRKYVRDGSSKILFSKKDLERLPDDFERKINDLLPDGGSLTVSKRPKNTGGGFLLTYGGTEIDCTFKALVEKDRDAIVKMLENILLG